MALPHVGAVPLDPAKKRTPLGEELRAAPLEPAEGFEIMKRAGSR